MAHNLCRYCKEVDLTPTIGLWLVPSDFLSKITIWKVHQKITIVKKPDKHCLSKVTKVNIDIHKSHSQ